MSEKGFIIDGYIFSTNKDYRDAKEEQESIQVLRSKTDLSNPGTALKLYNKLIENRTFHTVSGLSFLKELQNTILSSGIVKTEDLEGIYIPAQANNDEVNIAMFEKYKLLSEKQKVRIRNSRIINIFLVFTILVMIIISIYSDKTMYANLENKVIDQYSDWEQDLTKREEALDQVINPD